MERTIASAEMMEASDTIEEAARSAGTMAGTCGDCHRAQGIEAVSDDGTSASTDDFMQRHRWATDKLWDGLIGPSEAAWQAGAAALSDSNFTAAQVQDHLVVTSEIEETRRADGKAGLRSHCRLKRRVDALTSCGEELLKV